VPKTTFVVLMTAALDDAGFLVLKILVDTPGLRSFTTKVAIAHG